MNAAGIIGRPKDWARDMALATGTGVILGIIGVSGPSAAPLGQRIFAFVALCWITAPLFFPTSRLSWSFARRAGLSSWLAAPISAVPASVPVSLGVSLLWPLLLEGQLRPGPSFLEVYPRMLAVNLAIGLTVVAFLRLSSSRAAAPPTAPTAASSPPRLLARLPPPHRCEILALEAEDHYVRVHTTKGSTLLLMRLADAVAELDGLEGLQVHRSWWVAKRAVARAIRNGRRLTLELTNGAAAPVTRENVRLLREAGWV